MNHLGQFVNGLSQLWYGNIPNSTKFMSYKSKMSKGIVLVL